MNKKVLSLAFATMAISSIAQAKLYFGIEGGYSSQSFYGTGLGGGNSVKFPVAKTNTISHALDKWVKGYSVAGVVGSENLWGGYIGNRSGLSVGYTSITQNQSTFEFVDAGISSDLILNFYSGANFSFGVFGGVEADYHYALRSIQEMADHLFDINGRVGVTTLIAQHHRIELMAKLPIASLNMTNGSGHPIVGGSLAPARTSFLASYKFVF